MVGVKVLKNYLKILIDFGDICNVQGAETVDTSFFITKENLEKLEKARETNSVEVRCLQLTPSICRQGFCVGLCINGGTVFQRQLGCCFHK